MFLVFIENQFKLIQEIIEIHERDEPGQIETANVYEMDKTILSRSVEIDYSKLCCVNHVLNLETSISISRCDCVITVFLTYCFKWPRSVFGAGKYGRRLLSFNH